MSSSTSSEIIHISDDQWLLVKRTLMDTDKIKFSDDEFKLFMHQVKRTGLDPFTRQIYATKIQGKMTVQATIDGLRVIAQRSGEYEGQTRPVWFDHDGTEHKVWPNSKGLPYACEVGVFRRGFREPLYAMAIFEEYCPMHKDFKSGELKMGFMWDKMPALMVCKVAEALALRKAFPNDLSGIYASEEMQQAESLDAEPARPIEVKQIQTPDQGAAKVDINDQRSLFELARKQGYSDKEIKETIKSLVGVDSSKEIPKVKLEMLMIFFRNNKK